MTSASQPVLLVTRPADGVLLLRLDRPAVRNALNTVLLQALAEALEAAERDPSVRVALVTGDERAFAAGADIDEMAALSPAEVLASPRAAAWTRIFAFAKPLLAAVEGYCLGGGQELALAADLRIAGEGASFGQPEINLGLVPGAGGLARLAMLLGTQQAMRLVLTGRRIDAAEALRIGLVAETVPAGQALARALELGADIAAKPPIAIRLAKARIRAVAEAGFAEALAADRQAFALLFSTADRLEGLAAFREKRPPRFEGR